MRFSTVLAIPYFLGVIRRPAIFPCPPIVRYNPRRNVRPIVRPASGRHMAGGKQKLTARAAATSKPDAMATGRGSILSFRPSGRAQMGLPLHLRGKVTEMGLGSADVVSLAQARDKARDARRAWSAGRKPYRGAARGCEDRGGQADIRRRRGRAHCREGKRMAQRETSGAMAHDARKLCRAVARRVRSMKSTQGRFSPS